MFRTGLLLVFVLLLAGACGSTKDPAAANVPGFVIVRTDDNKGTMEVWVNGVRRGGIKPGGKYAFRLPNGRHTISVKFNKLRSAVIDFIVVNNRQNFRAQAFINDKPNLTTY